jgi:hypothetical protein
MVARLPQTGARMQDVIELAGFVGISDALRRDDVPIAWEQIHGGLVARVPGTTLDVVFDQQLRVAALFTDNEDVLVAVRCGRPVLVIPLGETIRQAMDAFRRLASVPDPPHARATPASRKKRAARPKGAY